jgi:exonuclease SbcC
MSFLPSFRKPAWQSGSAERRLAAVTEGTGPELLAALPRLALADEDAAVRRQALRRCDDPALFQRAMTADADAEVRAWARQRWLSAVLAGQVEGGADDLADLTASELEQVASDARSVELRRHALGASKRAGFLVERALAEPDAGLRLGLVERIESPEALDRLADRARGRDKRVAKSARDRAQALRLAAGDQATRQVRAQTVCAELEALLRSDVAPGARVQALEAARSTWLSLGSEGLPADLVARFRGAEQVLQAQIQGPPRADAASADEAVTDAPQAAEAMLVEPRPAAPAIPTPEEILAQARMQAELAASAAEQARERALGDERRAQQRAQSEADGASLDRLEQALAAGDLGQARTLAAGLDASRLARDPGLARRWLALAPQLKTLAEWERWAAGEARSRLCESLEALAGSALHPDALAERVREAQQAWRQLDQEQGRAQGAPMSGLDRRFRAACARVMRPAKGYFDKRDALRKQRADAIEAFLQAGTAAAVQADLAGLLELQGGATGHLRELAELAPTQRKSLAARLRVFLDELRPGIDRHFQAAESGRQVLIDAATALAAAGDHRRAASEGRQLQQRWKALPAGRQARDQQQWRQFRKALDEVFAGVDQQRKQDEGQRQSRALEANALIDELDALAGASGEALEQGQGRVRDLRSRWQALAVTDQQLGERFDNALTRHRDALREQQRDRLRLWALAEIEAEAPVVAASAAEALVQARGLVFEMETLAGLEPPESERDARRQWQLQRLQQHLRGDRPAAPEDALSALLAAWRRTADLSAADRSLLAARLGRAVERYVARS